MVCPYWATVETLWTYPSCRCRGLIIGQSSVEGVDTLMKTYVAKHCIPFLSIQPLNPKFWSFKIALAVVIVSESAGCEWL